MVPMSGADGLESRRDLGRGWYPVMVRRCHHTGGRSTAPVTGSQLVIGMRDSLSDVAGYPVADAEIEAFRHDGVVCLRRLLDTEWVARMRAAVDRVTERPGPMRETYHADQPGIFFSEKFLWTVDPDFRAYALNSPLAATVGRLMGSKKVCFFYDHLLVKEANTPTPTHWHQDLNYWPWVGRQICTVWFPMDRVTRENGTLEFVRGSHRWYDEPMSRTSLFGQRAGQPADSTDSDALPVDTGPPQPDVENQRQAFDIVAWDLDPGDVLVFTALTLHYASGNPTDGRRRALATRWLGDDMRWHRKTRMLQLLRDPGLRNGNVPDSELFPVVWEQAP